ncbi:hypothetical protein MSG37_17380 [Shewanella sp. 1CM18E]|uniref:M61 family metallopeptidase n=1 Tax=Shewanella sp. 1CM18E TaxID=2929169 RepID=UPI0020C06CB4|nr:hypothetical protein [Shewanella sp. 1CM18E]MCK8046663.1 hypothetical protein [Shewanella sp. 1CM18E]
MQTLVSQGTIEQMSSVKSCFAPNSIPILFVDYIGNGFFSIIVRLCIVLFGLFSFQCMAAEIDIIDTNVPESEKVKVRQWLNYGVNAVSKTLGPLPQKRIEIEVIQQRNAREPVPFAEVNRSKPIKVKLTVDAFATLDDFIEDWTLYHELSHLYLPYLDYPSFWLTEGFATYMQYVTMLKSQIINRQSFIERMRDGFIRGANQTEKHPGRLADVADNMWQRRAYKRVYWSGAAFFVEVDYQLMSQDLSLADVITRYSRCCLREYNTGKHLMAEFDNLTQTTAFTDAYQKYAKRRDFPKISELQIERVADYYSKH